jgi:hypothetical protein
MTMPWEDYAASEGPWADYASPAAPTKRSAWDETKRQGGLLTRSALNTVASLPLTALEGGAGIANLATGGDFSFRKQWDEGLNAIGLPQPETGVEKVTDVAAQTLFGSRMPAPTPKGGTAPAGFQSAAESKTLATADRVRKAQEAGYVIPPATGNKDSMVARGLEGLAGKTAVGMRASSQNMANSERLAARSIGLSEDAPVTSGAVRQVREEAAQAYEAVRGGGVIALGKPCGCLGCA